MGQLRNRTSGLVLPNSLGFAVLVGCITIAGCGGGGGNSGGGTQPPSPTITSVSVTCAASSVATGKTLQCTPTVAGTGSYSSAVTWAVNGTSGGSATYGSISASGLYQAPTAAPSAYIVTLSAMSSADSTKSGSATVLIEGIISSATQPIVASAGGTISLPGGASVTIPARALTADAIATLQLDSIATQPTNTLFGGIGPSLLLAFSPAVGGAGAAAIRAHPSKSAVEGATVSSSAPTITFVIPSGQGLSATQLQNAFGVLNVNDGTNNFFSVPTSYDGAANETTLTVNPSMIEPSSTLEIGIAVAVANGQNQGGNPSLVEWNDSIPAFTNTPANFCPTGSRTLILVHGMFSDVKDSFGKIGGVASCALKTGTASCPVTRGPYDTVLGINYDWSDHIASSGQNVSNIINSFFTGSCSYNGTIDIEAHSEGTLVSLTAVNNLSSNAKARIAHIVLVAGPIEGTPLASDADPFITPSLNEVLEAASTVIDPSITQNQKEQLATIIPELANGSSAVLTAQSAATGLGPQTELVAVGGDKSIPTWWGSWIETLPGFVGVPNDGAVPVVSALPTDSLLPNLVRLVGDDPASGDYPYAYDHFDLVNSQNVISDVFNAVDGKGATALVTLGINPASALVNVQQVLPITAVTTNILNPQIAWNVSGGSAPGSINSTQGESISYTAPSIPGGPYSVTASLPAVQASTTLNITVVNQAGTVTVAPSSVVLSAAATEQFGANVTGGGAVTWSIQEGASGGNITAAGLYTAPSTTGTFHVLATNAADLTQTATATVTVVAASPISTIHSFNGATEGAIPWSAPIVGSDGNLYGVTEAGGNGTCGYIASLRGCGTIYMSSISSNTMGTTSTLHNFSGTDGAYPTASLTLVGSDMLYGTTGFGGSNTTECVVAGTTTASGCGEIFSYSAANGFSSVYSFGPYNGSLGISPEGVLVPTSGGSLYGTNTVGGQGACNGTLGGISQPECGTAFQISSTNSLSPLYEFEGPHGAYPTIGLLPMSDGNYYGATDGGGNLACSSYATPGCGTIFQMTASGTVNVIHQFNQQDGAAPDSKLILGNDGYMYGTTLFGGTKACSGGAQWQGCGTVFKIDPSGNFTLLYNFSGPDGAYPGELMLASDGYFYGTTESGGDPSCSGRYGPGCGTIFRMDSSGNVTIIYSFTGQSDGSWPESAPVQGPDGNLYGTTAYGGTYDDGVIFEVSNVTALSAAKAQSGVPQTTRRLITPLLMKQPHVGLPGPPVPAQH